MVDSICHAAPPNYFNVNNKQSVDIAIPSCRYKRVSMLFWNGSCQLP